MIDDPHVFILTPTRRRAIHRRARQLTALKIIHDEFWLLTLFIPGILGVIALGIIAMLLGTIIPGTRWAFNFSQSQSLVTIDHVVHRIDRSTSRFQTDPVSILNRPVTTTPWAARTLASYYNTALAHPARALLPQTQTVDAMQVTIQHAWLTNGAGKWQWQSPINGLQRGDLLTNFPTFARQFSLTASSNSPSDHLRTYALVQPITYREAYNFWTTTMEPDPTLVSTPPIIESFASNASHNPAYLVLWVTTTPIAPSHSSSR